MKNQGVAKVLGKRKKKKEKKQKGATYFLFQ